MNYFEYVKAFSMEDMFKIYEVVRGLKNYAMKIYKNMWEDALDQAYFHIISHYDESCGELENYATRIVGTILLGRYRKEIANDVALEMALNTKQCVDTYYSPVVSSIDEEDDYDGTFNECVEYLSYYFVLDYKFFKTLKKSDRVFDYTGIFKKFSSKTVLQAIDYLNENYGSSMDKLLETSKKCTIWKFKEDRYKESFDRSISYVGMINGILLYTRTKSAHNKLFYSFNIEENIRNILSILYPNKNCVNEISVGEHEAYCSLSGVLVVGIEELVKRLEIEIIGVLLTRKVNFNIIKYDKGKEVILSCVKDIDYDIKISCFGEDFSLVLKKVPAKRVK